MQGGNTTVTEVFGLGFAIITLAALGLILTNGKQSVNIIKQIGSTFNGALKTATFQNK